MFFSKEKIKALQEKYRTCDEESWTAGDCDQSLGLLEHAAFGEETDERLQTITDSLAPCKTELSCLEEELASLKRKFRTPRELIELDKRPTSAPLEAAGRSAAARTRDPHTANQEDVEHMVRGSSARTYTVHIPASVLDPEEEEGDLVTSRDTLTCKVGRPCWLEAVTLCAGAGRGRGQAEPRQEERGQRGERGGARHPPHPRAGQGGPAGGWGPGRGSSSCSGVCRSA